jgi:hypothetical protein
MATLVMRRVNGSGTKKNAAQSDGSNKSSSNCHNYFLVMGSG